MTELTSADLDAMESLADAATDSEEGKDWYTEMELRMDNLHPTPHRQARRHLHEVRRPCAGG